MNQEKIKERAYQLYELRTILKVKGDANNDYQRAKRILEAEEFIEKERNRLEEKCHTTVNMKTR